MFICQQGFKVCGVFFVTMAVDSLKNVSFFQVWTSLVTYRSDIGRNVSALVHTFAVDSNKSEAGVILNWLAVLF